jgi:uncharacterized protein (TIGR02145 family)
MKIRIIALMLMVVAFVSETEAQKNNKNTIDTVKIGNQVWMKRNLDVDHYRNGDSIPKVKNSSDWTDLKTGGWCYYNNDTNNREIYGKLYNWYAVNDLRGLAPEGWHVATDEEWKELEMCLGMTKSEADEFGWRGTDQGSQIAGTSDLWSIGTLKKNKKFGISHFSALPGGWQCSASGSVNGIGYICRWWTATQNNTKNAWYRHLDYRNADILRGINYLRNGFSVRCVRDKK